MTKTDSVAVLREFLDRANDDLRRSQGLAEQVTPRRRIAAFEAALAALSAQGEAVGHQFRWRARGREWSLWQDFTDTREQVEQDCRTPAYWNTLADEDIPTVQVEFRDLYLHPAPPGADAVTEAVPSDVMQHARHMVEGHYPRHREYQVADWLLRLAARTGKGEA